MRGLLVLLLLVNCFTLQAQQPEGRVGPRVHLNKRDMSVYIALKRVGELKSPQSPEDKDRVWLRLHNNTRWPIRLNMSGVPTAEYGDAELYFHVLKNGEIIFRNDCHVCSINMLPSGRSLVFSVPRSDLEENHSIRVQFSYGWEDWSDAHAGREPEHYVYFHSSQLPNVETKTGSQPKP
jgi:hypothetical protein